MHTQRAILLPMKVFDWSAEKNRLLVEERGVAFEEAAFYIQAGGLLDDIAHPNTSSYPNQRLFVVLIGDYVYLVPYVEEEERIFLKTIIPSRKFTKLYPGGAR